MDPAELAELLGRHADRHSVPGAALGLLRRGAGTTAAYEVADGATGGAVGPETRFAIGSLTKSMVATVIAELAAADRLSFDDLVTEHVPEVRGSRWARDVTIRDLMANRSGLPLRAELEFGFDLRPEEDADALRRLVSDIPRDEARSPFWSYSNVGWCVLGRAIEGILNTSWEEAMRSALSELGLTDPTFPFDPASSRAYAPAGTTTTATIGDLLRLAAAHLDRPELAVLRELHADVAIHAWLDGWGLGWARYDWTGVTVWGWDGLIGGARSTLRLLPDRQTAVVLLTSGGKGRAMYRSLFAELAEPELGVTFPALDLTARPGATGDLDRFTGQYAWPDRRFEVVASRTGLLITNQDDTREAVPIDEQTFLLDADDPDVPTITFGAFDAGGRPGVLYDMLWAIPRV